MLKKGYNKTNIINNAIKHRMKAIQTHNEKIKQQNENNGQQNEKKTILMGTL